MTEPALEFLDVRKRFAAGAPVLDGLRFAVAPSETVALVGPSGSGKTTALKLANRLLDADAGEVRVFGRDVRSLDPIALRRKTGWVIQEGGLFPHWTVLENVETVPRLMGWPPRKRRERAERMLELVGLTDAGLGARWPRELSGGQRQRVGVARALAADPPLLLMDEPFGALDALARRAIQNEFRAWKSRLTAAVVLVTHDLREAFRLADRVAVLHEGRLRQIGPPEELRARPADVFVRELLQELEA